MKYEGEIEKKCTMQKTLVRDPEVRLNKTIYSFMNLFFHPTWNFMDVTIKQETKNKDSSIWHLGWTTDVWHDKELNTENNVKDWTVHDLKDNDVWKPGINVSTPEIISSSLCKFNLEWLQMLLHMLCSADQLECIICQFTDVLIKSYWKMDIQ